MARLTREQYLEKIKDIIGEDTSDESITLLEDLTDTYDELEQASSKKDDEDWKQKYEENDKQWRQKYRDRFYSTGDDKDKDLDDALNSKLTEPEDDITIDDLFKPVE